MHDVDSGMLTQAYVSLRQQHNDLRVVSGTAVDPSGFTLLAVLRNEMYFLPAFLTHYRRLGVQRFVFLDDGSDDGSFEYLTQQPDSVVLNSNRRFGYRVNLPPVMSGALKDPHIHFLWQSMLCDMFAMDRWVLQVDLDEFIHLPLGMTFADLVPQLDKQGERALWAVMLDVYPKNMAVFAENAKSAQLDTSATWYFDGERHLLLRRSRSPKTIYPGARARLYSEHGLDKLYPILGVRKQDRMARMLRKVGLRRRPLRYNNIVKPALLKWGENCYFKHPHSTNLLASWRHLLPMQHFRFSGSLVQRAESALRENNHFLGSSDYRLLTELLHTMTEGNKSFLYRNSRPLESFNDLVETRNAIGLM